MVESETTDEEDGNDYSLEDLEINDFTQPMHLFLDGSDEAVCGISVDAANSQNEGDGYDAGTFPATNNFESVSRMAERWDGDQHSCPECGEVFERLDE